MSRTESRPTFYKERAALAGSLSWGAFGSAVLGPKDCRQHHREAQCGPSKEAVTAGKRRSFTVIELLVVIAIFAILAALLLPAQPGRRTVPARQSTNSTPRPAVWERLQRGPCRSPRRPPPGRSRRRSRNAPEAALPKPGRRCRWYPRVPPVPSLSCITCWVPPTRRCL